MKFTKLLSLALAMLMVFAIAMTGCAKEEKPKDDPDVNVVQETEDKSDVYDSEIHDMHGHEFWFLVGETTHTHLRVNEV